ncbi:MAG: hypothetical protein ACKV2T_43365 [Kofleriaceae bacterium]
MKPSTKALVSQASSLVSLGLGALMAMTNASCWVERRTSDFACETDDDCIGFLPTRECDTGLGYCVPGDNPNECPLQCTGGCDMNARTCTVICGSTTQCNDIVCPNGFDCTINCSAGACDSIDCRGDQDCTIICTGGNACGDISCPDTGNCSVTCTGGGACADVDCNGSNCDVICSGGNACDNVDCDSACRCDVSCMQGGSCDRLDCSAPACESAMGCTSTQTGCPATCN